MKPLSAIGKYLDQPLLTTKISKNIPMALSVSAGAYLIQSIYNAPKNEKKKTTIKNSLILGSTVLSAIAAPYIASKLSGRQMPLKITDIVKQNTQIADKFLKTNSNTELTSIIEKAKNKILSLKEISKLFNTNKEIANNLIPPPANIQAKDIFKEIGYLSIYGAIPVLGGILGGIAGDKLTEKNWKKQVPNKINEGMYQYIANIFLCNIGAGIALGILEKLNIKSKTARCIGMVSGILLMGVIGGSVIANYIGNKFINPVVLKNNKHEKRTPELLDLTLHTDDIATVSLLSGLKWIEPSLPILYSISGYRAGIGYRNDNKSR